MLRLATEPRCSDSLAEIRDKLTIRDVLDLLETVQFRDELDNPARGA